MWLLIGVLAVCLLLIVGPVLVEKNKKKVAAEESRKRLEKLKQNAIAKYHRLAEKYNPEIAMKLVNAEYFIGMTKEQLLDSKGFEPEIVEIQTLKTKTKETLVFGETKNSNDWFVLENGLVVKITDKPDWNTPTKLTLADVQ